MARRVHGVVPQEPLAQDSLAQYLVCTLALCARIDQSGTRSCAGAYDRRVVFRFLFCFPGKTHQHHMVVDHHSCPGRYHNCNLGRKMNNKIIKKSIIVNRSLHDVWLKWTTHEGLLTFFGRDNKIELRPGGPFEIYFLMDNPPGLKGSEGCTVLSYLPERMLSYTWNAPPEYPDIRNHDHQTWVVIFFKPIGESKTEVELNHLGWLSGEQWDAVYNYFEEAWESVLDLFEKSCEEKK